MLHSPIRLRSTLYTILFVLLFAAGVRLVWTSVLRAQGTGNKAGLVIDFGGGYVQTQCVEFTEDTISGGELLDRASFDYLVDSGTICKINGDGQSQGCNSDQGDPCFCECLDLNATCIYWTYWKQAAGIWEFAEIGAFDSGNTVNPGAVDGWRWGISDVSSGEEPMLFTFEEICNVAEAPATTPTDTATETATATQQADSPDPTVTHTPTKTPKPPTETPTLTPSATLSPTPAPTHTPSATPIPTPGITSFTVNKSTITYGETITMSWIITDASNILLRFPGGEESVGGEETRTLTPEKTITYRLVAQSEAGEQERAITIEVVPVFSAPPLEGGETTDTVANFEADPPTETPTHTETPTPTLTPTETPTPTESPTATPSATESPIPTETGTPTKTPTGTPSPSITPSPTETRTPTQTDTPPPTGTPTQTRTPTLTPAPSDTPTAAAAAIALPLAIDQAGASESRNPPTAQEAAAETAYRQQLIFLGGIAFVVGIPLLFGAIWLMIWALWRRK